SLQDGMGMGLYVPLVNQAFWTKAGPKMQATMLKLWADNLPTWRENTAKSQLRARDELSQHGVTFVDVPQAERDAMRAKMVKDQDKVVAEAHISPELVKLV